jgi:hypothetical protein
MKALLLVPLLSGSLAQAEEHVRLTEKTEVRYWNGLYLCSLEPAKAEAMIRGTLQKRLLGNARAHCKSEALLVEGSLEYSTTCENGPFEASLSGKFICKP